METEDQKHIRAALKAAAKVGLEQEKIRKEKSIFIRIGEWHTNAFGEWTGVVYIVGFMILAWLTSGL